MTNTGATLYEHARQRIPGGTQLLSKRPEMFLPGRWPSYYSRAQGVDVWDLDGQHYVDMSYNGIGACILGTADPEVDEAVIAAVRGGSMSTLNCPEEVELADLMCELHPWAEMVRFARGGGEAMVLAVRIARARTRRDRVAFCGYHGWHDWYLAANLAEQSALDGHLLPGLSPVGVPRGLQGTALPFRYNHPEELDAIVATYGHELAAVVLEPIRGQAPEGEFLERVATIARDAGAVLIYDEITSGFRITTGGAHLAFGVEPDLAVFAKAVSNGYPMAIVIGRADVMQAAQDSFISSTYWTDRVGPAAALATIRKHRRENVPAHLARIGERVQAIWRRAAVDVGLRVHVSGLPALGHLAFEGAKAQVAHTLYTKLMLERRILASKGFYATFAHQDAHVDAFEIAVRDVFARVHDAWHRDTLEVELQGPVAHTGFHRLT